MQTFVYSCLSLVQSRQRADRVLVRWRGRRRFCGLQSFLKIQWLRLNGMCVYLFVATTLSSIRLKSCCKSEWLTWRSPSGVVARWPPAVLCCVRAPAHLLKRRLADRSLCRVIDKRPGSVMMELSGLLCGFLLAVALPTHSETHQNATSHLIRPEFLSPADRLGCSFHFSGDRPGKRNDDGNTWRPEFTKKPLWRSVRAREKETKLSAVKGGNKSRVVRCCSV